MKKSLMWVIFMAAFVALMAMPAFAETEAVAKSTVSGNTFYIIIVIVVPITMAFTAVGVGLAQSSALKMALEGIARNPGAAGSILSTTLVGLAIIESLAIYVLVIGLILLFANPFLKLIG